VGEHADIVDNSLLYTNTKAGYSLEYPKNWQYDDSSFGNPAIFYDPVALEYLDSNNLIAGSKIEIYYEPTNLVNVKDAKSTSEIGEKIITENDIILNGHSAVRKELEGRLGYSNLFYFVNDEKLFTIVQHVAKKDALEEYSKYFDDIIETFKFTD